MLILNKVGSASAEKYTIHAGRKTGDSTAYFQRQLPICPGHPFIFQVHKMAFFFFFFFFTNINKNGETEQVNVCDDVANWMLEESKDFPVLTKSLLNAALIIEQAGQRLFPCERWKGA